MNRWQQGILGIVGAMIAWDYIPSWAETYVLVAGLLAVIVFVIFDLRLWEASFGSNGEEEI